jgi:hypothetical protein
VEGSAPTETKEVTSKAQPLEKNKDDGGTLGPARNVSGNRSGCAALRREQVEQLESSHRENRGMGWEGEPDHSCHKHSLWKRNGGMPVGHSG